MKEICQVPVERQYANDS